MHAVEDYKTRPFLAAPAIGKLLRSSALNLFLGAGASAGFGLPEWVILVARILGHGSDTFRIAELSKLSDKELTKLLNEVDDENRRDEYLSSIHKALYADVKENLLDQLTVSPLLLAAAALITGSVRGRVQCVFTYNYDNMLEQYLAMLGLGVCVRKIATDLSTRADVEINHLHGYLPQSWKPGDTAGEVVLSGKTYRKRRAEIDKGWSAAVENSMYSKFALLVGLSADDSSILDVFKRAQDNLKRPQDYNGYWILTPSAYQRNAGEVIEVGLCPIPLEKEQIPKFLFSICQEALLPSTPF
jgi:hypothetical protein